MQGAAMNFPRKMVLVLSILLVTLSSFAAEAETSCQGISTILYSSSDVILTICHGPYTEINRSKLDQWQNCDDAMIQIQKKGDAKAMEYAECMLAVQKQFSVQGSNLLIRHFFTEYPEFEKKPMLVESIELKSNKKKYEFVGEFTMRSKEDFENAIKKINSTVAKPFDEKTFFSSVYGGFFILRDYAAVDPESVLSALRNYQNSQMFDGEVAETLSEVMEEVKLIYATQLR
jgi:hypothetical protein